MVDQTSQFYAILTTVGAAKQANADALGIPWRITHLGVGDANGVDPTPNATQTRLINEWRRAPLNQLKVDEKNNAVIVAEQVIPAEVGGKWIREIGLYDADGDMIAVANCPPTFKPTLDQGSGRTQVVRMNLLVSSSTNVELKIDPAVVLATREYVDKSIADRFKEWLKQSTETAYGWIKIATDNQLDQAEDDTAAVTPLKLHRRLLKLLPNASETSLGRIMLATQEEVTAGEDDAKAVTSKKLKQRLADYLKQATESSFGWIRIAGTGQVDAGTDDTTAVTPLKLSERMTKLLPNASEISLGRIMLATHEEVAAGEDDAKAVTSKKLKQRLADYLKQATESSFGWIRIAGTGQVDAGTDDTTAVTPLKLSERMTKLLPNASETSLGRIMLATHGEVTAGEDDAKAVTSKKLKQRLADYLKQATESSFGWLKLSTQAQTDAGADDSTAVTPKKMRWGFSASFAQNGYIVAPTWMGSFIMQWGVTSGLASAATGTVFYPLAFNAVPFFIQMTYVDGAQNSPATRGSPSQVGAMASNVFNYSHSGTGSGAQHFWFALGR